MVATFTDLVERWSCPDMKADLASGFFGVLVGIVADTHQEAATLACRMHLLDDPQSPDDILPLIGEDRRLGRYYLETADQHRARLIDAWNIYAKGASEVSINEQLRAAGFGPTNRSPAWGEDGIIWGTDGYYWNDLGTYIEYRPSESGPRGEPAPYFSQFWVIFQPGFHPVIGPPIPWGTFTWGDTYDGVWGPLGYSPDFKRTVSGIIRKWKGSRWICRGLVFKLSEQLWGQDGFLWAQDGCFWGGGFDVPFPLS